MKGKEAKPGKKPEGGESLEIERQPNLGPDRLTLPSPGCNGPAELGSTRPLLDQPRWMSWLLSWVANPDEMATFVGSESRCENGGRRMPAID